jgi:hypothetical protein
MKREHHIPVTPEPIAFAMRNRAYATRKPGPYAAFAAPVVRSFPVGGAVLGSGQNGRC